MDRPELDALFSETYEELRRLAASVRQGESAVTLNPTALVNEAYLKLASSPGFAATSRTHFKRIAARAMRQVLIEAARKRGAVKRGGGSEPLCTLGEGVAEEGASPDAVLALDLALERLSEMNPRQAQMVEYRFFGGLELTETAELLGVSEATVTRDWRAARAWLSLQLRSEE